MKLAVIVGRFQTSKLTEGHIKLIETVSKSCDAVLICVGVSPVRNTRNEPLPFSIRKYMIEKYCHLRYIDTSFTKNPRPIPRVIPINDLGNVEAWNKQLDKIIDAHIEMVKQDFKSVVIYGGRDSVVSYYSGKYKTKLIPEIPNVSATQLRDSISMIEHHRVVGAETEEFRMGMIYASQWRYPTGFPTADAACFKRIDGVNHMLLCRKPNRTTYQLPGGFFDPLLDKSLENTALRELSEECNISADIVQYHGSYVVDDFRYRKETDKIVTSVFECLWIEGEPVAKDDVEEVKWFKWDDVKRHLEDIIFPAHQQIILDLIQNGNF